MTMLMMIGKVMLQAVQLLADVASLGSALTIVDGDTLPLWTVRRRRWGASLQYDLVEARRNVLIGTVEEPKINHCIIPEIKKYRWLDQS